MNLKLKNNGNNEIQDCIVHYLANLVGSKDSAIYENIVKHPISESLMGLVEKGLELGGNQTCLKDGDSGYGVLLKYLHTSLWFYANLIKKEFKSLDKTITDDLRVSL